MNRRATVVDRAAEQLVNMDNAGYADEREQSVNLEAEAFGMQLTRLTCWVGALLFAVSGQILLPLVLVVLPLIPELGSLWYAARRGVNQYRLMSRGPLSKTLTWTGFYAVLLFGTCMALVYRSLHGEGLVPFSVTVEVIGDELQHALAVGAILGVGLGAVASVLAMGCLVLSHRRSERRESELDESGLRETPSATARIARSRVLPVCAAVAALVSLVPLGMGARDSFAVSLAGFGVLYSAGLICLHLWARRKPAVQPQQD